MRPSGYSKEIDLRTVKSIIVSCRNGWNHYVGEGIRDVEPVR